MAFSDDLPWLRPRSAYLHIPFCAHRCGYCDFAVSVGSDALVESYLDALEIEIQSLQVPHPVETIFVGGGTPTYLNARQLQRLGRVLNLWFPRAPSGVWECSIESTPESLDSEKAAILAEAGFDRISLGVQSFRAETLAALDRVHSVADVGRSLAAAKEYVPSVSLDLIFGAPGQTIADWCDDLNQALSHGPDHLSTYGLTYEKGTALWKSRRRGDVVALTEDDELAMYREAIAMLESSGFRHYEISNFAQPGRESLHNRRYWANEAYFGFGVGAARYVDGIREHNIRDTRNYVKRVLAGESPTQSSEKLAPRERAYETIAVQLRRAEGIDVTHFQFQTGQELHPLIASRLDGLLEAGLLTRDANSLRLTSSGKYVADAVIEELMKAAWD